MTECRQRQRFCIMSDEKTKKDEIQVSSLALGGILTAASVIFAAAMFIFFSTPYTAPLVFTVMMLVWAAYYAVTRKQKMSEMCCMMNGMIFGMTSGFFVGALVGLATSDFLVGMIVGTAVGMIFGIPIGKMGGPLARMEAVMAGPMGGIMGAMTGVMVKFFNVQIFMIFFALVIILTIWETINLIKSEAPGFSKMFLFIGVILSLLIMSSSVVSTYEGGSGSLFGSQTQQPVNAAPSAGIQEITVKAQSINYEPSSFIVKKDVPVKLTIQADRSAGCTRAFVFPEFNIRSTIPAGSSQTFEFTPTKTGTFPFSCAMSMARGTMIVQ